MGGGIHPPPSVIESWPTPNYVDPPTQGWGLVILIIVLSVFSVITVALRIYVRAWVQRSMGIDDWIMLFAMFPTIGMMVGIILESKVFYFDRHVWDVPPTAFVAQRKLTFAQYFLYVAATGPIKLSILFFYRRMTVSGFKTWFLYTVWASIFFVAAYTIAFIILLIFNCTPVDAFWFQLDTQWVATHSYSCIPEAAGLISASSVSLAQDFLVATLPTVLFTRMEIPPRQKIALGGIFAIGYFLCATGALRIYYIYRVFYETYDVTWQAYDIWAWTAVEVLCATIIASLPALKVLFRSWFDATWLDSWRDRYASRDGRSWKRTGSSRGEEDPYSADEWATGKSNKAFSRDGLGSRGDPNNSDRIERAYLRSRGVDTSSDSPTLGPVESSRDVEMGYLSSSSAGPPPSIPSIPSAPLPNRGASSQSRRAHDRVIRIDQEVQRRLAEQEQQRHASTWEPQDPIVNTGSTLKAGRILGM